MVRPAPEVERKSTDEMLHENETWYRRLVETAPGAILIISRDGRFFEANGEARRILGLRTDEVRRHCIADYAQNTIYEDGRPCPVADYPATQCLGTGQPQGPRTIGVHHPDGSYSWAVYSAVPLRDLNSDELIGVMVTFFDITEQQRAQQKLKDSEEFHRLISEIASDYAYDCAVGPDGELVVKTVTEGFERVTGYTLEEVNALGGWACLIYPEDMQLVLQRQQALHRGQHGVHEVRIVAKSGAVRWIRYLTRPILDPDTGRLVRLLGAVHDITAYKEYENKLQDSAQTLQALSRRLIEVQEQERRHLARELHDDIGQLLTGLKLSLEMSARLNGDKLRDLLAQCQRQVQDLTGHVRNLSLQLRPTMLDDLGLLPAVLWHVEGYTRQTGVQVALEHRGMEGKRFGADVETAAFRIIQEALTNVARHARVRAAMVHVRLDDGVLVVEVSDEGRGFDPRRVAPGTSSGLSGMQERASLLGGSLKLDSSPGAGVRLTAELPVSGVLDGKNT
jgi:PAS domain S-box-containing protein